MADQECAWPLDPADPALPETVREIVDKARTSWLRNAEVFEILTHATEGTLPLSSTAPDVPDGTAVGGWRLGGWVGVVVVEGAC